MANGDAAIAAGMDVVAGTADLRLAYDEENKGRDYLADHMTSGTHDASAINAGVLAPARIPTITDAKVESLNAGKLFGSAILDGVTATVGLVANVATLGNVAVTGTLSNPTAYGSVVSSGRTLAVRPDGTFGYFPSGRRFKKNIKPADIDPDAILRLRPVEFDYRAAFGGTHDIGLIAEDVAAAGLDWLVYDGDQDGEADGLEYARLVVPLIATVQALAARVAELEKVNG